MVGCPGHFTYSVGKGGLIQMTRQIAVDYGPHGILCNAVAPGKIVTGTPGDLSAERGRGWRTCSRARRSRGSAGPRMSPRPSRSWRTRRATPAATNLMVDGGWMAY